jgi:ribosomal protein S27AE
MEKAETGSVGRALSLCGYGTQFASELEEGQRIVDAPINGRLVSPPKTDPRPNVVTPVTDAGIDDSFDPSTFDMEVVPEPNKDCPKCKRRMMISLYNDREWYCKNCKLNLPRQV